MDTAEIRSAIIRALKLSVDYEETPAHAASGDAEYLAHEAAYDLVYDYGNDLIAAIDLVAAVEARERGVTP